MLRRTLVGRELLDIPGAATQDEIEGNLKDIAKANRLLGGTSLILHHLSQLLSDIDTSRPVNILDMGTGYADVPISIVEWARRRGIDVRVTGVDINPVVVDIASEHAGNFLEIHIERADVLHLPYKDGSFDVAMCSQVLHHLDNDEAVRALHEADRVTKRGLIVSELQRRGLCILLTDLVSRFIRNRLSAHDVRISFRNGFTREELGELAEEAGLPAYRMRNHGPCRIALVTDKRTTVRTAESARTGHASVAIA